MAESAVAERNSNHLSRMTGRPWLWWTLTALWSAKIFWMSTSTFNGTYSGALLKRLLTALNISLTPAVFDAVHILLRKSAHVWEYAVLGTLLYCSLDRLVDTLGNAKVIRLALIIAAAYSLSDEFHQSFVHGRGASLGDCMLDITGAILGILLINSRRG